MDRQPDHAETTTGDAGVALPLVLGTMAVVILFLLTAMGMAMADTRPSRGDQSSKVAVAAAQAGIDEYLSRLNTDDNYWARADPTNPAFTTGAGVPGTGGAAARFTYRLLTTPSQTSKEGYVSLEVTGTASAGPGHPEVSRTLTARLQPDGFLDFLYFTDVEAVDPALYASRPPATISGSSGSSGSSWFSGGSLFSGDSLSSNDPWFSSDPSYSSYPAYFADWSKVAEICPRHYYEGRSAPTYTSGPTAPYWKQSSKFDSITQQTDQRTVTFACKEVQWAAGDVVDGPLHSNDALQVNGAVRFADPQVESSWATGDPAKLWWGDGTPVGPTASPPGHRPHYAPTLALPQGNGALLKHVLPKVDADPNTDRPGCLYRGATKITFKGSTMEVRSPNTTAADTPSRCLDVGNRATTQTKPIPPVIHVVPASGTSCTGVGFPASGEKVGGVATTDYAPCKGTAFVSGVVDGQVTVSAQDDIVVTGDVTLEDDGAGTDVAGLVAGNNVWVYHPVTSTGANLLASTSAVRTIEASVLALRHSFVVQNWRSGAPLSTAGDTTSKLRVYGAIAQKYRGPVGTGSSGSISTGYAKNYVYDPRLKVLQPPYFLEPDNSPWVVAQLTDG